MNRFVDFQREHRRRAILDVLVAAPDAVNTSVIADTVHAAGIGTSRHQVRDEALWLSIEGLVTIEHISAEMWMLSLTEKGEDVASGKAVHSGVPIRRRR